MGKFLKNTTSEKNTKRNGREQTDGYQRIGGWGDGLNR